MQASRRVRLNSARGAVAAVAVAAFPVGDAASAGAKPRNPEIKDYEIARFIYLKTSCGMRELTRLNPGGTPLLFHADCNNASAWPGGMDITCREPDDDRTCTVTTEEKHFKYLDLLRQK